MKTIAICVDDPNSPNKVMVVRTVEQEDLPRTGQALSACPGEGVIIEIAYVYSPRVSNMFPRRQVRINEQWIPIDFAVVLGQPQTP